MRRFWSSLAFFFKTGLILPVWQVNGVVLALPLPESEPSIEPEHGQSDVKVLPVVAKDGNNRSHLDLTGMGPQRNGTNLKWRRVSFRWFYWGYTALRGYKV